MKEKYQLKGPIVFIEIEVEKKTAELLSEMCCHTKISESEITNMALKFFASTHKDFLKSEYLSCHPKRGL